MYSIKPGRGPSMGGAIASIIAAIFGIFWTIGTASLMNRGPGGGPPVAFKVMLIGFGVLFVLAGIGGAIYNFYNATARNRLSHFDITTHAEETDPFADAFGHTRRDPPRQIPADFCPYCGERVQDDFNYCPKCGKDI